MHFSIPKISGDPSKGMKYAELLRNLPQQKMVIAFQCEVVLD